MQLRLNGAMPNPKTTYEEINNEIKTKRDTLERIHKARFAVRGYNTRPTAPIAERALEVAARALHVKAARRFSLLAQGDSWFDYPPGTDLIDCLHSKYGHRIVNIAVAGSTLNDEAYGPVPRELFGLPTGRSNPTIRPALRNLFIASMKISLKDCCFPPAVMMSQAMNSFRSSTMRYRVWIQ